MRILKGTTENENYTAPTSSELELEKMESLEAGGYLHGSHEYRAGDADRKQTMTHITKARTEGRLTDEQHHARMVHAGKAQSQDDLRKLVKDLPSAVNMGSKTVPKIVFDSVKEIQENYPNFFHFSVMMLILSTVTSSFLFPTLAYGVKGVWETSAMGILPVFVAIAGLVGFVINAVFWAEANDF